MLQLIPILINLIAQPKLLRIAVYPNFGFLSALNWLILLSKPIFCCWFFFKLIFNTLVIVMKINIIIDYVMVQKIYTRISQK